MKNNGVQIKELLFFIFCACAISWPMMLLWQIPAGQEGNPKAILDAFEKVSFFFAFGPLLSAAGVTLVFRRWAGLKQLFRPYLKWRVGLFWYFWALLGAGIAPWAGFVIYSLLAGPKSKPPEFAEALRFWCMATPIISLLVITEETGWRGFVLPRILTFGNALAAGMVMGAVWSFWHTPLWIAVEHGLGQRAGMVAVNLVICYAMTMLLSVVMTWVYNGSGGSLLLMLFMHGSGNASLFMVMQALDTGGVMNMTYKISYTLALLLFAACVVICYGPKTLSNRDEVILKTGHLC